MTPIEQARDAVAIVGTHYDNGYGNVSSVTAIDYVRDHLPALIAENERLAERVAELEGALRALVKDADKPEPLPSGKVNTGDWARESAMRLGLVLLGHLPAARALLTPKQGD